MAWGGELMGYVTKETGMRGVFTTSASGPMFQVSWLFGCDSAAQLDEATAKLAADASYAKMVDGAGHFFVDGSVDRAVIAKMP
jgi:hypothetical protein